MRHHPGDEDRRARGAAEDDGADGRRRHASRVPCAVLTDHRPGLSL